MTETVRLIRDGEKGRGWGGWGKGGGMEVRGEGDYIPNYKRSCSLLFTVTEISGSPVSTERLH